MKNIAVIPLLALLFAACQPAKQVAIELHTTPGEQVFITGNTLLLGRWKPGLIQMTKFDTEIWGFLIEAAAGDTLEFTFTRGANAYAADPAGARLPKHTLVVRNDTALAIDVPRWKIE